MAYSKKTWVNDEVITHDALNNIETGVDAADKKGKEQDGKIAALEAKAVDATTSKSGFMSAEDKKKLDGITANANNYTLPAATTNTLGGVKKMANVPEAAGENVTKAEFKKLLDEMKNKGFMEGA